jgi:protein-tyrosine phosphatase
MAHVGTPSFDCLLNFRDVGRYINQANKSRTLKEGLLYRSAKLDDTSLADRSKLVHDIGIKTVIDLRSKTEHINAAKKHSDAVAITQSAAVPSSNDAIATPLKIPGISYAEINLNGKGFERALIWKLKYTSLARLIFLMAVGYRTEGIAVLGREIMLPRGLVGLGLDTLDHSGPEVKEVFDVLSEASAYPVLVQCTQGKDRTGMTILLVLLLCDIDLRTISADYARSELELESEKEERLKEIRSIGLDETFAQCPPAFCARIEDHLTSTYGGIRQYLLGIGVDSAQQDKIRSIMLG